MNTDTQSSNMDKKHKGGSNSSLSDAAKRLLAVVHHCASDGTLKGRKKMMKLGFFAEYLDRETDTVDTPRQLELFDFTIYKYGPFSRDLLDAFDELRDKGLIEETQTAYEHEINITDDGNNLGEQVGSEFSSGEREQIKYICRKFGDNHGAELERKSLE